MGKAMLADSNAKTCPMINSALCEKGAHGFSPIDGEVLQFIQ